MVFTGMAALFHVSEMVATAFQLVGVFAFAVGSCFSIGKLIAAMSDSGLFPSSFALRTRGAQSPIVGCIVGQVLNVGVCVVALVWDSSVAFWPNIICIFVFLTYIVQLVGFLVLRMKLNRFPRQFTSPVGIVGAIFALCVFVVGVLSILIFHNKDIYVLPILLFVMTGYYYGYAKRSQTFSVAEMVLMMPAHVEIKNVNG